MSWWLAGALGAAGLCGCGGEEELRGVVPGLSADSVVALVGTARGQESFLAGGRLWEVLYIGEREDSSASQPLIPVVLADERVVGVGWSYWEREARRLRITLPPR